MIHMIMSNMKLNMPNYTKAQQI